MNELIRISIEGSEHRNSEFDAFIQSRQVIGLKIKWKWRLNDSIGSICIRYLHHGYCIQNKQKKHAKNGFSLVSILFISNKFTVEVL